MRFFPKCQKCHSIGWCNCSSKFPQEINIKELIKKFPNDQELGAEIRRLFS